MNTSDYHHAWAMISSWRDTQFRTVELATLRASQRRPYVVIAMIRIAAMLVTYGDVSEGFAEQLRRTPYQDLDEGILHITDQIMRAVKPDAQMMKNLATVVDSLAGEEPPESEPSASALKLSTTVDIPPNVNPHTGKSIRVDKAPIFARVKVRKLGSLDTHPGDLELLGQTVITWTEMERSSDMFAEVQVRGILRPENEVVLSDPARPDAGNQTTTVE